MNIKSLFILFCMLLGGNLFAMEMTQNSMPMFHGSDKYYEGFNHSKMVVDAIPHLQHQLTKPEHQFQLWFIQCMRKIVNTSKKDQLAVQTGMINHVRSTQINLSYINNLNYNKVFAHYKITSGKKSVMLFVKRIWGAIDVQNSERKTITTTGSENKIALAPTLDDLTDAALEEKLVKSPKKQQRKRKATLTKEEREVYERYARPSLTFARGADGQGFYCSKCGMNAGYDLDGENNLIEPNHTCEQ